MMRIESWNGVTCLCCDGIPEDRPDWLSQEVDFVRCSIKPEETQAAEWLSERGFFFADRRLDVRVKARQTKEPAGYRFQVELETKPCDVVQGKKIDEILGGAFTHDRRFHLRRHYDKQLAAGILKAYRTFAEDSGMERLVCRYKDEMIGCMYLQETKEGYFVYLAAVQPAYQGTGAAVELYQKAVSFCKEQNGLILSGNISSSNTGVMNIYARLGGTFHGERDIYLYEKKG